MGAYSKQAAEIVEAIGGKENIGAATHCVTRLRFALKDEQKVDQAKLEEIDVVKGSFSANGQFQVVIGQGTVNKVYQDLVEQTGIGESSKEDVKKASESNLNPLQRAIKTLADIFIPILPAIVTAGLLLGLNNILTGPGIFFEEPLVERYTQWADIANIINLIANTAFTFLPALIGWSAVKRFGGSQLLGIVLGLILVHPDLLNAWAYGAAEEAGEIPTWNILGLTVEKIGYQGQVLPVLFAAYLLARIETFLTKRVPEGIQLLVVAPVALLITGFAAFLLIGPVMFVVGNAITDAVIFVFNQAPLIGGLLYGGFYSVLVITGMHHTFLAVDLQLVGSSLGGTFLWPMLALSNIAQGSAALTIGFSTKEQRLKGLSYTSALSAYLGVTEPAIFGVNLRFRHAFIAGLISAAIAGAFISVNGVLASTIGVGGIPGFLVISNGFYAFLIGMAMAAILPIILTMLFAKFGRKK